ncbi:MAG: hypothetical protein ACLPSW_00570 [Roseiarcus sp.]
MVGTTTGRAATIAGRLVRAGAIASGFGVMTERGALILHAIVAPIALPA